LQGAGVEPRRDSVRIGKDRPFQSRFEPLPFPSAHPHARRTSLDESGSGSSNCYLRNFPRPRQHKSEKQIVVARSGHESINRIASVLLEALHASGYIHWRATATAEEKLRRMLRRFALSSADAEVLLGMLRKILWKLKSE